MKIWELMRLINDKPLMAEVMFHNNELWYMNPITKGWIKMERVVAQAIPTQAKEKV